MPCGHFTPKMPSRGMSAKAGKRSVGSVRPHWRGSGAHTAHAGYARTWNWVVENHAVRICILSRVKYLSPAVLSSESEDSTWGGSGGTWNWGGVKPLRGSDINKKESKVNTYKFIHGRDRVAWLSCGTVDPATRVQIPVPAL